ASCRTSRPSSSPTSRTSWTGRRSSSRPSARPTIGTRSGTCAPDSPSSTWSGSTPGGTSWGIDTVRSSASALLLVENNAYPFDVRVRREAHALRDAGHRVTVIAPRTADQPWTEELDGVRVYRFPGPPGGEGVAGYAVEYGYSTLAMLVLALWVFVR